MTHCDSCLWICVKFSQMKLCRQSSGNSFTKQGISSREGWSDYQPHHLHFLYWDYVKYHFKKCNNIKWHLERVQPPLPVGIGTTDQLLTPMGYMLWAFYYGRMRLAVPPAFYLEVELGLGSALVPSSVITETLCGVLLVAFIRYSRKQSGGNW